MTETAHPLEQKTPDRKSEAGDAKSNEYSYLFVDLDGTLIRTDLLVEASLKLLKRNPLNLFRLAAWLLKGRTVIKDKVAELIDLDADSLPYEKELIEHLKEQKRDGKQLILATASHHKYARKIAAHLGIFDHTIATTSEVNLKGARKLAAIKEFCDDSAFSYAGDSPADRPIWKESSSSILVNASPRDVEAARARSKDHKVIETRPPLAIAFLKEMRVHQWAKNTLIFVPLLTSHAYLEPNAVLTAVLAFFCFSLLASGVYFFNDLMDLDADRRHVRKRNRPLASGDLPITSGIAGAAVFPLLAFGTAALFLPLQFIAALALYFVLTLAYSFRLKRVSTADVMTLAVLYTLRVIAGALALNIAMSSWLLAFSVFIFVSLAYLKRYIEVEAMTSDHSNGHASHEQGSNAHGSNEKESNVSGRGYTASDSETMFCLGIANATAAVLVLALYLNSVEVAQLYRGPEILWLLCFLMLYWSNRIWVGARRRKIGDDPVLFALTDNVSRLIGVIFVLVALMARYVEI